MSKKVLLSARDTLQKDLLAYLAGRPEHVGTHVSEMVTAAFAPLIAAKPVSRALLVKQIGQLGYRVTRTTNLLDIPVGSMLTPEQTAAMQADGVNVSVMRNT